MTPKKIKLREREATPNRNLPGFYPSVEPQLTETGQLSDQTYHLHNGIGTLDALKKATVTTAPLY